MPISYKNKIYTILGTPTGLSGNVVSATDSAGVPAKDYTVKGRTIVWNQLLNKDNYRTRTIKGVTFTANDDGTITANGTATGLVSYTLLGNYGIAGHKYCCYGCPAGGSISTYRITNSIYNSNGGYVRGFSDAGTGGISPIVLSENQYNESTITIASGITVNNLVFKPQIFDLTDIFGAGNEPTTVAEFRVMFPDDYYPYNAGELKAVVPTSVEAKNQSGETRFVNIPSSKYFPDGMRSAGSVYDEINFLSQKAIKRVGVRAYQTGDENDANVMTDKINTVYILATPVETAITPPLQALSTFKGFTSFSVPNSLTQNGPLSVTYYAEGGTNPEKGWLTSYKRKLYMGRSIEWNQMFDKSKYPATTTTNGVTFTNNGDGTITVNGTCELSAGYVGFYLYGHPRPEEGEKIGHKYGVFGCPSGGSNSKYRINASIRNSDGSYSGGFSDTGGGNISKSAIIEGQYILCEIAIYAGYAANSLIFKPQLFDLTQMFGAGNEPATPEEFWSYFDHKLYPYNPGETHPLFKISRKSQWGSATPASLYVGENIIIPQIIRN